MGIRKLDSFNNSNENRSETTPPFIFKGPSVSLYSTDDPVDKLPLVLVPLVSSAGVGFPQVSELPRSFTSEDDILDNLARWNSRSQKLRCIPGFKTTLPFKDISRQLREVGAAFFSFPEGMRSSFVKSPDLQNVPHFPSSFCSLFNYFMSGLRVCSVRNAVFNIKVGEGFLIQEPQQARYLAQALKSAFKRMQMNTSFFLIDSNQPAGRALGNSLEIKEAIEILKGSGPLDLLKLALELGSEMLLSTDKTVSKGDAKEILKKKILSGDALKKFREIIEAQKGDTRVIDKDSLLPSSAERLKIHSHKTGFIHKINTKKLYSIYLQCVSKKRKSSNSRGEGIGFLLQKKCGEWVEKGEDLVEVHLDKGVSRNWIENELQKIFTIAGTPPAFQPLIIERKID